ncbi:MAG TPA: ABC transporter permease [Bryobacteraceae bacterium]|nr:ABC transporter permease [Bryobacteraceae bacterium]
MSVTFAGELQYSVRSLTKSPLFVSVAVLSLGLGIGANTAVFSLLDQALLRLLPVPDARRLVQLKEIGHHYGSNTGMNSLSYPIYKDFSEQNRVFSGMLCRHSLAFSVSSQGRNERVAGEFVSGTYFPVLGVRPAVGRLFTAADDQSRGGSPLAVLGYDYWQNRFGGDPSIIGKPILVNNHKLTIIGVAAKGFQGVERLFSIQIYVPVMMAAQLTDEEKPFENRRRRWVQVFARLKPGVTRAEAKASLQPVFHAILAMEVQQKEFAHASPYTREEFLKMSLDVMPGGAGQSEADEVLQAPLWAMMAMVGLVLLIACANVANLIIARSMSRQREIAVRLALGATRRRIVGQLLVEGTLLSLMGGVLGLALSIWIMHLLVGVAPHTDPPLVFATTPDSRVLLFNLAVSLGTALLFGLLPALQATRADVAPTLKDQAGAVAGGGQAAWRKVLVCVQVGLSLLLLIGAGLFVGTLKNLKALNPGFAVTNLLSFSVDPTLSGYNAARSKLFYQQLNQKLDALPGVRASSLAVVKLLSFDEWDSTITVEGYAAKPGEDMNPWVNYVSPGFFSTLRIPVYAGREFTDRDRLGAPKVAIVNEMFAKRYFGDRSPIGRRIGFGGDPGTKTDIEIVGVVRDTKYQTVHAKTPRQVFFPYLENDWASEMTAYVRTDAASAQMFPALRSVVHRLDPNLPVYALKTEESQLDDSLSVERLTASLASAFGLLATVLAAVGLYGVMAFLVTRRTREIGIRMALGARGGDVLWLVMREVLVIAAIGIAIGLPAALAVTRLVQTQLYGMSPSDPLTIALAILGILMIAALSGYVPARRASQIDPTIALRYE